jgi:N-acylneuraminate cytidylyltransferase
VPFLREGLSDDFTPISAVTIAVLDQLHRYNGERHAVVVQLMANCPLRGAADIRAAIEQFEQAEAPFQISCTRFGWLNPWWAFQRDEKGHAAWQHPEALVARSQDLEALYCPTGAIWIARTDALAESGTFYGPGHRFEPLSWESAVDIDDADDLAFARAVLAMRQGREP